MARLCEQCGAELETDALRCSECRWSPFIFKEEIVIRLLWSDGVRVPATQLSYSYGDRLLVGELTYTHAEITEKNGDREESRETTLPTPAWGIYEGGQSEA